MHKFKYNSLNVTPQRLNRLRFYIIIFFISHSILLSEFKSMSNYYNDFYYTIVITCIELEKSTFNPQWLNLCTNHEKFEMTKLKDR